jgi:hypothetical protein
MGIAPSEVKRMSVWEFIAVTDRWIEAHEPADGSQPLREADADEIWDWMQTKPPVPLTLKQARQQANGAGH